MNPKEFIARRAAQELEDNFVVNLGIGLPTMVANYLSPDKDVTFQSENGIMGLGVAAKEGEEDYSLTNAGGQPVTTVPGAMFFDSAMSFGVIRGGHVDITMLGALQVAQNGDIASWKIPGKLVPGMGGAMDLVTGAKKVVVVMLHTQKGTPKIKKECTLPLTGAKKVTSIITEMGVFKVTDKGLLMTEIAPDVTVEEVKKATEADLIIADDLKTIKL